MPMCKRFLCAFLAFVMLLTLAPGFVLQSNATGVQTTSEECIAILKEMEGFIEKPTWDHHQYSVGYGSRCNPGDYPNGITEEQADALLREFLADMEGSINLFIKRNNIILAQHQFDAIMLFTYNCGTGWTTESGKFRTAVIEGYTGNDFLYPISLWSTASSKLQVGLVKRRLIEADMYLNGSYTNERPSNYTYVIYNNNGGEAEDRVQGFDCNAYAPVKSLPTREGYRFLGWYTAEVGGGWVTELDAANAEQTIIAHWQAGNGDPVNGTLASYQCSADQLNSLEFRETPGGTVKGSFNNNAVVNIIADYVDANGIKWGKTTNGGWVNLGNPLNGITRKVEVNSITVKVTGDYVNVRSGPGTNFSIVSGAVRGNELQITEVRKMSDGYWGKFRAGWIRLDFTTYDPEKEGQEELPESGEPEDVLATGVITASSLNIRRTPGKGQVLGTYSKGEKVYILEVQTVDGTKWGRTDAGWISLSYVKLDEPIEEPEEQPDPTDPSEPEEDKDPTVPSEPEEDTNPSEPEEDNDPTDPSEPETDPTDPSEEEKDEPAEGFIGIVTSKSELMIRSGPGTNHKSVGSYPSGTKIRILEQKTVNAVLWGRTDKGWVCMQYVRLDYSGESEVGIQGTVISNSPLNVRSGAGVFNARVGSYAPGSRITIYEQTFVNGQFWGRADKGWVCMDYVILDSQLPPAPETPPTTPETGGDEEPEDKPEEQPEQKPDDKPEEQPEQKPEEDSQDKTNAATGTVTASGLNVRSQPGTNSRLVGAYRKGEKVSILEQKLVNGQLWGRTDIGWISLAYVKLDAQAVVPGGFKVTVTASSLIIRKGPGTDNAGVGTYRKGTSITILETKQVGTTNWGRTELGWVSMDYVK